MKQSVLHEWLNYDPETGIFTWKKQSSSSKRVGDVAGRRNMTRNGKRTVIAIQGRRFYAARAAYIYVHGDIPDSALVDHINGNIEDDRIANLRLANPVQNVWNRIQRKGAQHKMGVSKTKNGAFRALIQPPGQRKKILLGTWKTEDEAHAAYMGAAAVLHGEFWIGGRPR
jgi:hypothetical protein